MILKKIARYKQWRRTWATNFQSPWVRLFAWWEMVFTDHGFMRPFYNQPYEFAPGMYRSNHPSPKRIKRLAKRGLKTIITLRGVGSNGHSLYEIEACAANGIKLIPLRLFSRRPPPKERIHEFKRLFETLEKPALLHCKSGADRAGIGAALYILLAGNGDITAAQAQLSAKFLHFKQSSTGVLDHFLQQYATFNRHTPISFIDWVDHHYDPEQVEATFKSTGWANLFVDWILRRE